MSTQDEKTPLMDAPPPPPPSKYDSPFYFVQKSSSSGREDSDGKDNTYGSAVVDGETKEPGASSENHFRVGSAPQGTLQGDKRKKKVGFFSSIFGGSSKLNGSSTPKITNSILRPKKPTIGKVDAKIYFANERTYLAWTHTTVLLAGASIAIIAFAEANPWAQLYGVLLLPISICFIIYAMIQYTRRSTMIHRRQPGPYDDLAGPLIFGAVLVVSLVADFVIKLVHAAD